MAIHSTSDYLEKGIQKNDWVAREMLNFRFKKLISAYNQMRLRNDSERLSQSQWLELAKTFRPKYAKENPMGAVSKTKSLLSKEEVRLYANSQLTSALNNADINIEFVVNKRKDILEKAIENKQLNVANATLDIIEDYMGIKSNLTQQKSLEEENNDVDYVGLVNEMEKDKLPEVKKELPQDTTETPSLLASS